MHQLRKRAAKTTSALDLECAEQLLSRAQAVQTSTKMTEYASQEAALQDWQPHLYTEIVPAEPSSDAAAAPPPSGTAKPRRRHGNTKKKAETDVLWQSHLNGTHIVISIVKDL